MMNAINFLDGLDGLLSGRHGDLRRVVCDRVGARPRPAPRSCSARSSAARSDFLPYNFNPAKIFLGDSGALFIGYVFATVSIIDHREDRVHGQSARSAGRARAARRRHGGRDLPALSRGQGDHRSGPRPLPPHPGVPFRTQRAQAVLLIYAVSFALGMAAYLLSGRRARTRISQGCSLSGYNRARPLRVMTVFGTRPDTIKMAPVVRALAAAGPAIEPLVCVTAQHRRCSTICSRSSRSCPTTIST
jgi:hypothetical protein